jgi:hypothetical protein
MITIPNRRGMYQIGLRPLSSALWDKYNNPFEHASISAQRVPIPSIIVWVSSAVSGLNNVGRSEIICLRAQLREKEGEGEGEGKGGGEKDEREGGRGREGGEGEREEFLLAALSFMERTYAN